MSTENIFLAELKKIEEGEVEIPQTLSLFEDLEVERNKLVTEYLKINRLSQMVIFHLLSDHQGNDQAFAEFLLGVIFMERLNRYSRYSRANNPYSDDKQDLLAFISNHLTQAHLLEAPDSTSSQGPIQLENQPNVINTPAHLASNTQFTPISPIKEPSFFNQIQIQKSESPAPGLKLKIDLPIMEEKAMQQTSQNPRNSEQEAQETPNSRAPPNDRNQAWERLSKDSRGLPIQPNRRNLNLELTPQMMPMPQPKRERRAPQSGVYYVRDEPRPEVLKRSRQRPKQEPVNFKNESPYQNSIEPKARVYIENSKRSQPRRDFNEDLNIDAEMKRELEAEELRRQIQRAKHMQAQQLQAQAQQRPQQARQARQERHNRESQRGQRGGTEMYSDRETGHTVSNNDRMRYLSHWFNLRCEARLAKRKFEEYNELIGHLFGFPQITEGQMLERNYFVKDLESFK